MDAKQFAIWSAAGMLALAASTVARADVVNSKHDLTVEGESDVCIYCHTPHNGSTDLGIPLWNRDTPAGPYTMYSSPSIEGAIATNPQGVSLACLSCHDGTLAYNAVQTTPPPLNTGSMSAASYAYIGTDLTNDHPISIQYGVDTTLQPYDATADTVGQLKLYSGAPYTNDHQVECGSCHDPHNTDNGKFLRISNANSAVCTTCHTQ